MKITRRSCLGLISCIPFFFLYRKAVPGYWDEYVDGVLVRHVEIDRRDVAEVQEFDYQYRIARENGVRKVFVTMQMSNNSGRCSEYSFELTKTTPKEITEYFRKIMNKSEWIKRGRLIAVHKRGELLFIHSD